MRRFTLQLAVLVVLTTALATRAHGTDDPTAQPQIVLKVASIESSRSPLGLQLVAFQRHVAMATNGKVRVKLLFDGRLGAEAALVAHLQSGRLQAFAGSVGALSQIVPEIEVLRAPYLQRGQAAQVHRALDRSVRPAVEPLLAAAGLRFASWGPGAFRVWLTRGTHLRRPTDAKGVRVPVARGRAEAATYAALHLTQTPLGAGERPGAALARGAVDAFEATLLDAVAATDDRGASHLVLSRHAFEPQILVFSERWFAGLPEEVQQSLAALPSELLVDARKIASDMETRVLAGLRTRGVEVIEPTRAERAAFVRVTKDARQSLARDARSDAQALLRATGLR